MRNIDDLKNETKKLHTEIQQKTGTYIMAGLGLIASLAWNEAIKALIEIIFPITSGGGVIAKIIYAGLVTTVLVIVSFYVFKGEKKS